ncbi:hypothetical protein [Azospirillum picis]|uniref:Uncharacterized protein n=1 Tax=Azospirillum picis TaxID=488438 RepID=A0ABU0MTI5_9PROT|nr:hypothetical protein [Azospirillum picis]MBP2303091.1 hypothetical protein [Azospirillum picis]MDQ0536795.1 hypothetical protein [Azospirillum picis]
MSKPRRERPPLPSALDDEDLVPSRTESAPAGRPDLSALAALADSVDDQRLLAGTDQFAAASGLPSLRPLAGRHAVAPPSPVVPPVPVAPPREPTEEFKVTVPRYLNRQLAAVAADRRVTKQYLVLEALRAAGYRLDEADLHEDGRRYRGRRAAERDRRPPSRD